MIFQGLLSISLLESFCYWTLIVMLKASLRKFYIPDHDLVNRFNIVSISSLFILAWCIIEFITRVIRCLALSGASTAHSFRTHKFTPGISVVHDAQFPALCIFKYVFLWRLYCLYFVDLQFLITPLVYVHFVFFLFFFKENKCGHRNVLSKRQVWMSIFHIIKQYY
jgi:hypothetical protein